MAEMPARQFIEVVFIHQVGDLVQNIPYIAFMTMGIGIEFLGKCLHQDDWQEGASRHRFEYAINHLQGFAKYRPLVGKGHFDLYGSLRCGLAHAAVPKYPITLSSKQEMAHLTMHTGRERLNLRCEDFYADFRSACEEVLALPDPVAKKLCQPFLLVPDYPNN